MFLDKFTKKQYKAYKNDIVIGIYHSKETVDKDLASGYIDYYKEVPEQIQFNGMFYDKYGAPKEFYFFMIKLKWLEFYCIPHRKIQIILCVSDGMSSINDCTRVMLLYI